ncbi:hypothetical protein U1Q18_037968, partial [Sarracenia purpurea var. burkii]
MDSEVSNVKLKTDSECDCFLPLDGNVEDVLNLIKMDEDRTSRVGEIGKVAESASKVIDELPKTIPWNGLPLGLGEVYSKDAVSGHFSLARDVLDEMHKKEMATNELTEKQGTLGMGSKRWADVAAVDIVRKASSNSGASFLRLNHRSSSEAKLETKPVTARLNHRSFLGPNLEYIAPKDPRSPGVIEIENDLIDELRLG